VEISTGVSFEQRSGASLRPATVVVFTIGFVITAYGLFFLLADGAVLQGGACTAAGVLLQVASGARDHPKEEGSRLRDPFAVVTEAVRRIRDRVRSWEDSD
jgi:hypothetical protein